MKKNKEQAETKNILTKQFYVYIIINRLQNLGIQMVVKKYLFCFYFGGAPSWPPCPPNCVAWGGSGGTKNHTFLGSTKTDFMLNMAKQVRIFSGLFAFFGKKIKTAKH